MIIFFLLISLTQQFRIVQSYFYNGYIFSFLKLNQHLLDFTPSGGVERRLQPNPNAVTCNISESETELPIPMCESDLLQILVGSSSLNFMKIGILAQSCQNSTSKARSKPNLQSEDKTSFLIKLLL